MMTWFKEFCKDFPTQGGGVVVALSLIFGTGVIVMGRLAIGRPFPEGYGEWLVLLGTLAGVSTIGMIGKRATDREYQAIKNAAPVPTTTTTETTSVSTETTVAASPLLDADPDKDESVARPQFRPGGA